MFRCEHCGSGYATRVASSWDCCPRCLMTDNQSVPLTFELGWRSAALKKAGGRGIGDRVQSPPAVTQLAKDVTAAASR